MNAAELREALNCSEAQLRRWIKEGLPYKKEKNRRVFDAALVADWLTAAGYAESGPSETVVHTRQEAAQRLKVSLRTFAHWCTYDDFPGKPGTPGRRDGHFPIERIEQWRVERLGSSGSAREQLEQVRLANAQLDLRQRLGQLIDAEDVRRFQTRAISTARAVLDCLPDKLTGRLPRTMKRKDKIKFREEIERDLADAYDALAEQLAGDQDEQDQDE